MPQWTPIDAFGARCKDKFIRVRFPKRTSNDTVAINARAEPMVAIPGGAVGYCYAASFGVIHVGFTRAFTQEIRDPTRYDYCVAFDVSEMGALEMLS